MQSVYCTIFVRGDVGIAPYECLPYLLRSLTAGCGERAVRCQWQMKRGERVAAVKISAAQMPLRNFGYRNRKSVAGPLV